MYANAIAARDAGVNLAFLCGNAVYGMVPLLPSAEGQPQRIIRRTGAFVGERSGTQSGSQYRRGPDGALLMGGRHQGLGGGDWVCAKPDHWLYEGTGMKEGDAVKGLLGWEWHGKPAKDLPGFEILATSEAIDSRKRPYTPHAGTIYNGPKDNVVFNAGTIWWAQGLSSPPGHVLPANKHARPQGPDSRVQRMTANLLERFIR